MIHRQNTFASIAVALAISFATVAAMADDKSKAAPTTTDKLPKSAIDVQSVVLRLMDTPLRAMYGHCGGARRLRTA